MSGVSACERHWREKERDRERERERERRGKREGEREERGEKREGETDRQTDTHTHTHTHKELWQIVAPNKMSLCNLDSTNKEPKTITRRRALEAKQDTPF